MINGFLSDGMDTNGDGVVDEEENKQSGSLGSTPGVRVGRLRRGIKRARRMGR